MFLMKLIHGLMDGQYSQIVMVFLDWYIVPADWWSHILRVNIIVYLIIFYQICDKQVENTSEIKLH